VPAVPARLQASHEPEQEESQHTPSTQLPLAHWLALLHEAPFTRCTAQVLPSQ
jgi:hypothetical protein